MNLSAWNNLPQTDSARARQALQEAREEKEKRIGKLRLITTRFSNPIIYRTNKKSYVEAVRSDSKTSQNDFDSNRRPSTAPSSCRRKKKAPLFSSTTSIEEDYFQLDEHYQPSILKQLADDERTVVLQAGVSIRSDIPRDNENRGGADKDSEKLKERSGPIYGGKDRPTRAAYSASAHLHTRSTQPMIFSSSSGEEIDDLEEDSFKDKVNNSISMDQSEETIQYFDSQFEVDEKGRRKNPKEKHIAKKVNILKILESTEDIDTFAGSRQSPDNIHRRSSLLDMANEELSQFEGYVCKEVHGDTNMAPLRELGKEYGLGEKTYTSKGPQTTSSLPKMKEGLKATSAYDRNKKIHNNGINTTGNNRPPHPYIFEEETQISNFTNPNQHSKDILNKTNLVHYQNHHTKEKSADIHKVSREKHGHQRRFNFGDSSTMHFSPRNKDLYEKSNENENKNDKKKDSQHISTLPSSPASASSPSPSVVTMLLPPSNLRKLRDEQKRTGYAHSFRIRPKSSYGKHNFVSAKVEKCLNYEKSHLHPPKHLDISGAGFKQFGPDIATGVSSFGSCYDDIPLLSTNSMRKGNDGKKKILN